MFTPDEISLIMEALDALESKAAKDNLVFSMLSVALAPPDEKDTVMKKAEREFEQKDAAQKMLEERVILLKAKLIQLRTTAAIDSVFQGRPE